MNKFSQPNRPTAGTLPRRLLLATTALAVVMLAACGAPGTPASVSNVSIDGGDRTMDVGASATLSATVTASGGASTDVDWSTSDDTVGTIDAGGTLTAVAAGTTEVTATSAFDDSVTDTITVTVTEPDVDAVLSVAIDGGNRGLLVGETVALTATVETTGSADDSVTWASSNESFATVDASGNVDAVAPGSTEITATSTFDGTMSDTVTITVTNDAEVVDVTIDGGNQDVELGTSPILTATVVTSGGADDTVTWASSNESVATFDGADGTLTTHTTGTTDVTATSTVDAGVADTVTITVVEPATVSSVSIDQADVEMLSGLSTTLTAAVDASGAASTDVTWTSSDASVATIDDDGRLESIAQGSAVVTATSVADPDVSDTIDVTVWDEATVTSFDADVALGSTVDLTWAVEGAGSLEIACSDGAGGTRTTLATPDASDTEANLALQASTCQTLHLTVTNPLSDDELTAVPSNVVLNENDDGTGSLRAALASASAGAVIGFASDVTDIALSLVQLVNPHDAHLILQNDVTISGPTASPVTVRSDDSLANDSEGIPVLRSRVFFVPTGVTAHLDGLVIADGTFIGRGGGVRNDGTLTLTNSVVQNNRAYYRGGGVYNEGTLTIASTVLQNNMAGITTAEFDAEFACVGDTGRNCSFGDTNYLALDPGGAGGGVYVHSGSATIDDSTIDHNLAVYSGGGIYVLDGASADVTDTNITTNTASDASVSYGTTDPYNFGGGVANIGTFTITGGEVSTNESANVGGGLANGTDNDPDLPMTATDVLITGNHAGEYGGGVIHYYDLDQDSLVLAGTTTPVSGNTAGTDGDNVLRSDINASSLSTQSTSQRSEPPVPAGWDR